MKSTFKIGELAHLYGIGTDTIRYYEEQGLISPKRGENGYRLYSIRDIWRMNVIRDLRALDFPIERIRAYLTAHNVNSTLHLLEEELAVIEGRIEALSTQRCSVQARIDTIRDSAARSFESIEEITLPARHCFEIAEPFSTDEEMDVLIKRLLNRHRQRLYIIGSRNVGARAKMADNGHFLGYCSALIVDVHGESQLSAGQYLSLRYKGNTQKTSHWLCEMSRYAKEHGLSPTAEAYEFIWIDIHETANMSEHVTELHLRVE